jgi:hypothetical protein
MASSLKRWERILLLLTAFVLPFRCVRMGGLEKLFNALVTYLMNRWFASTSVITLFDERELIARKALPMSHSSNVEGDDNAYAV